LAFLLAGMFAIANLAVAAQGRIMFGGPVQAHQKPCTSKTVQGSYGYYGQGSIVSGFGLPAGLYTGFGTAKFEGVENFTWTSSDFPGQQMTGTYTVNPECTMDVVFTFPAPIGDVPGFFVIVEQGKEFFSATPYGSPTPFVVVWIYKRQ
jgi:hypothetical protein